MQPPPSPIRESQKNLNHGRSLVVTSPTSTSTTSASQASTHGNATTTTAVSAALQGATLAFHNQKDTTPGPPKPNSNKPAGLGPSAVKKQGQKTNTVAGPTAPETGLRPGGNGALLAATQAAREHASAVAASRPKSAEGAGNSATTPGSMNRHITGGGSQSRGGSGTGSAQEAGWRMSTGGGGHMHGSLVAQRLFELHAGGSEGNLGGGSSGTSNMLLSPPLPGGRHAVGGGSSQQASSSASPSPSPSLIAATLAASRSASPVRNPSPQPSLASSGRAARSRGRSVGGATVSLQPAGLTPSAATRAAETEALDTAPIPPTTSLVSLFESKKGEGDMDPVKKRAPRLRENSPDVDQQPEPKIKQKQAVKMKPRKKPKPTLPADIGNVGLVPRRDGTSQKVTHGGSGTQKNDHETTKEHSPTTGQNQKQNNQLPGESKPAHKRDARPSAGQSADLSHVRADLTPAKPAISAKPTRLESPTSPRKTMHTIRIARPARMQPADMEPERTSTPSKPLESQAKASAPRRLSQSSASSDDTFVSASSVQSWAVSPTRAGNKATNRSAQLSRRSSLLSPSTPDPPRPPARNNSTPNLTLSSLTNAIVASNLASSRLSVSSSPQPPPVPAPRRAGRHNAGSRSPLQPQRTADSLRAQLTGGSGSHHKNHQQQRTGMLQTLRGPHPSLSDDEDARRRAQQHQYHRRRNKVLGMGGGGNRKHAHHEGSRRRWRDEITARERRRYEAVWASNRGLFLQPGWGLPYSYFDDNTTTTTSTRTTTNPQPQQKVDPTGRATSPPESDLVANIVVRDIWARSRLPADELAEVWDLVDRGKRGALAKDEFVVGMWLIDQRLRGRKIPARVGGSVWASAGGNGGIGGAGGYGDVVVPLPKRR